MKNKKTKLIATTTLLIMLLSALPFSVNAYRVGDTIGYALKTDIVATINGYGIPSYNVDGYTYVVVEDLQNYGFSVNYDNATRTLAVVRDFSKTNVTAHYVKPYVSPSQVGQREHTLLYTDIVTYLDGNYTPSHNINGQTIIRFDALSAYGDICYNDDVRQISLTIERLEMREVIDSEEEPVWENMSDAERREVNLFLSNFSEAHYTHGSRDYITSLDEEKISFAHTHAFINYTGKDFYTDDGKYMGISAADVDKILVRFFGETVPHKTPENSSEWFYQDGNFLMRAASGETYSYFTIADGVYLNSDGTYTVEFTVYHDSEAGCCSEIEDKSVYSLTAQEVKNHDHYIRCEQGIATIAPKTYNGENTYELVDYYLNAE